MSIPKHFLTIASISYRNRKSDLKASLAPIRVVRVLNMLLSVCWQVELMEFYPSWRPHWAAQWRDQLYETPTLNLNSHYWWRADFICSCVHTISCISDYVCVGYFGCWFSSQKHRVNCLNPFMGVRNVTAFGYASWVRVVSAGCRVSSVWSALWNVDCPGCHSCVVVSSGKIRIWEVYGGAHALFSDQIYFLTIFPAPLPFLPFWPPLLLFVLPCPTPQASLRNPAGDHGWAVSIPAALGGARPQTVFGIDVETFLRLKIFLRLNVSFKFPDVF